MTNKTFLITGGTTGIGLATAQRLSAEGAKVIVTGRNPETLASAKKVLNGVTVHPSDAGDLAAAQALGEEVKKYVGHLDGAFLNAGVGDFKPVKQGLVTYLITVAREKGVSAYVGDGQARWAAAHVLGVG